MLVSMDVPQEPRMAGEIDVKEGTLTGSTPHSVRNFADILKPWDEQNKPRSLTKALTK